MINEEYIYMLMDKCVYEFERRCIERRIKDDIRRLDEINKHLAFIIKEINAAKVSTEEIFNKDSLRGREKNVAKKQRQIAEMCEEEFKRSDLMYQVRNTETGELLRQAESWLYIIDAPRGNETLWVRKIIDGKIVWKDLQT